MRFFLGPLAGPELGDLGFEAGESLFDGGTPIVFRRIIGGCGMSSGEGVNGVSAHGFTSMAPVPTNKHLNE
ncbi:MAG: hypothetical protein RLZZ398_1290 [Verrucomicrobiota bacterium]